MHKPNNAITGTQNTKLSNHPIHDSNNGVALFYVPGTRLWIQSQRERKNVYGTACGQNYLINMTVYQSVWNPLWLSTIQTGRLLTLKNVSARERQ
jgi:hypothetical protein